MDITFQALKEMDIGGHVNRLRKHSSSEVKRLVKHVVRKWKDTVDEWVKLNQPGEHASNSLKDGDSPQQKIPQNGHHQVPDFAYSPNPHNGSSGSDKNNFEPERKPKAVPSRREALPKPTTPSVPQSAHSTPQIGGAEREQGLLQILTEMDGFKVSTSQEVAELIEDFSGAELQNVLNEAGILTARKDLRPVHFADSSF